MGLNIDTLRHVKHGSTRWAWNILYRSCEYIVFRRLNGTIASGLFAGLQFTSTDILGTPMPKILGTYEKEIQEVFEQWNHKKFNRFINVGGAEGFYAVGITKKFEVEEAIVYEMLEKGQSMIRTISEKNRVSTCVQIHSKCEEHDLYKLCDECAKDLVFIDVEGAEIELLSSRVLERLRNSTVVVEAHDFQVDNCTNLVRQMFSNTHVTKVISSRARIEKDFPLSYPFPKAIKLAMMDERRPGVMNWIIASPYE
jgi:hypothetical protein